MVVRLLGQGLVDGDTIHLDAAVGTYRRARGAAYAGIGIVCEGIVVSSVVYFFGLKREHIGRARHYA